MPTPVPYRTVTWGEAYTGANSGAPAVWRHTTPALRSQGLRGPPSDYAAVVKATKAGHQLVARTELRDEDGAAAVLGAPAPPRPQLCCAPRTMQASVRVRGVCRYPVKTMNLETSTEVWQTDTGPVAFPDLTRRYVSTTIILVWARFLNASCAWSGPAAGLRLPRLRRREQSPAGPR